MLQARKTILTWSATQWHDYEQRGLQLDNYAVFENAAGSLGWIGFGAVATYTPTAANAFTEVAAWLTQLQAELTSVVAPQDIAILGGFSFTAKGAQQQDAWGALANGYFVLPRFLVKKTAAQTVLIELTQAEFATADSLADFEAFLPPLASENPVARALVQTEQATQWQQAVTEVVQQLQTDPQLEKVVLARTLQVSSQQPFVVSQLLTTLRQTHAAVYHLVLKVADQVFISATPERLVALKGRQLATAAVAGTAPRASDPVADEALGAALLRDAKNRREQQIVVTAIRQQLQNITTTLSVPTPPRLLKSQQVQHLYTPITATLQASVDLFGVVAALHPTPALGGQPAALALPLIQRLEPQYRGLFGAPFGYATLAGDGEFAVAIRSMLVQQKTALLFAGAGIVAASQPAVEVRETALKFEPMLQLLK
ncbi:isochorismate synthase [Loigolactobacillus jiayinensis]|uniref:isochorismate synthase n=1 Tax=Loigolactobacillus jiayinensis TaxID=2486016 RepID=A0ABW1RF43_9LACO|nr:isochorismate synthase [Loigolactobacillus jiayinensis]